ncbi:hypothetical protein V8F20_010037 [Naviculisporaceae sp. PSN 640]
MAPESQREWPNLDDGAMSEANSSVQVHPDSRSTRGPSTSRTHRSQSRRRSPSRNPDPESTRQPAPNSQSQSSTFSSQPVPENLPQEDVLIDLIVPTEPSLSAVDDPFHGLKRPHDGESAGEPSPKRDKLGEELEQMMADAKKEDQPAASNDAVQEPSVTQTNGARTPPTAMRRVLPMRHARKPSTQTAVKDGDQQGGSSAQNSSSSGSSTPRTPRGPRPK